MSKLSLAHACGYSFGPEAIWTYRPAGPPAQIGTVVHAMAEAVLTGRNLDATFDSYEEGVIVEGLAIFNGPLRKYLETGRWTHSELGTKYDAENDAATIGPRRGEPGYGDIGEMTLPGTLDLVRVEGDRVVIRDIKTGKPPKDREQLYAQAVAVSRLFKVPTVEVGYTRALKTKLEELDVETLDADRLDEEAGRIARVLRSLPVAQPNPGDHCWRCDAKNDCPAYIGYAKTA